MKQMGDGSVIPDGLNISPLHTAGMLSKNNFKLMVGTVIAKYYPDDSKNLSKKAMEYDISCFESNENGSVNIHTYFRCRASDLFGSGSDSLEFTYRPDTEKDPSKNLGSLVLALCINGVTEAGSAIIVGGLQSLQRDVLTQKADGHFYDFNFNGIRQFIDNDGAFSIEFNSALDNAGKQANKAAAGTVIKIDKDGRVSITDNEKQEVAIDRVAKTISIDNGSEKIVIDKGNQSIDLNAAGPMNSKSGKAMSMKSGDSANLESAKDMTIKSGSNLNVEAQANGSLKTSSNWNIKAGANVNVQAGAMVSIQASSTAQIKGTLTLIGDGSVPAALVGISQVLSFLGPIPIPGNILTGSATVFLGT